ncbi:T9SS type A sorting domain-containing protein [Bacteroidota bacterium]
MEINLNLLLLLLNICIVLNSSGQDIPPLVYNVENSGAECPQPPLPTIDELPIIKPLTDPFEWSDGSSRDTSFASWACRRAEIKAEIENYEIGPKPVKPDTLSAVLSGDSLLVITIIENGDTLYLISIITLPEGEGPFPAIISIPPWPFALWSYAGSLPEDIFTSRNIASVTFNFWEVMAHAQTRGSEPINALYPDLTYMGAYSAWSWGVSRLIDGLELVSDSLSIDLKHLAISGCSFAGKMALFAGAFDERIALTIAQESGGGGAPAWRVSETLDAVEDLGSTSSVWFMSSMFQFSRSVTKLPHDHHELMAMCAPRALLVTGNTDFEWLANPSCYVSARATQKVYNTLGIGDRFGFYIDGGHGHCAIPESQRPAIEAFVDKFLLGDSTVNTNVETHPYPDIIPEYWYDWWGTGDPKFANLDRGESEEVWLEAECTTIGAAWNVRLDTLASNESYVVPKPGLSSTKEAPVDNEASINFTFTVNNSTTFYLYGRVNCPTTNNDSYWVKLDDGEFRRVIGLISDGWEWKELRSFDLTPGEHSIAISYRVEEAKLDKICISDFNYPPGEMGETAETICVPDTITVPYSPPEELDIEAHTLNNYTLDQNYPNPLTNYTNIAFVIPSATYVSLKIYSILGKEIAELAGKEYVAGRHTMEFGAQNLSKGMYFYTLRADRFSASRKMIIQTE